MEISGKVYKILPLVTGEGKNGTWKKLQFVIDTGGQFGNKVCFAVWGVKIDEFQLIEGEQVTISFDIESREYNDRWFTEAKAWKVARQNASQGTNAPANTNNDFPSVEDIPAEKAEEDLPF